MSLYIGVDGCKGGWIIARLTDAGEMQFDCADSFPEIWKKYHDAKCILVDIPIGLLDGIRVNGSSMRECDIQARKILGWPRRLSVFPVPCRQALQNWQVLKKKVSRQSYEISRKIREVDQFLIGHKEAQGTIREVHPEILFCALSAEKKSMNNGKKTKHGFQERINVLLPYQPRIKELIDGAIKRQGKGGMIYGRDDLLDALVAAIAGETCGGNFRTIPERPERDSYGLSMEIVLPNR